MHVYVCEESDVLHNAKNMRSVFNANARTSSEIRIIWDKISLSNQHAEMLDAKLMLRMSSPVEYLHDNNLV